MQIEQAFDLALFTRLFSYVFMPWPFSTYCMPSGISVTETADDRSRQVLSKARRRGLRRITPAMTTAFVWAVLAASTVRAQQIDPSGREPITQSLSTGKTAGGNSTRKSSDDQFYGMAATRGARYLLRNGLDYLNYKEYERALKFLREAETRKDELNKAEKLVLQKGIESAQRGLRQAAGAEYPYALTERSRNRRGFSAADPETHIAEQRRANSSPNGYVNS